MTGIFFLCTFYVFAQRNPNQEILVFFSEGVSQEIVVKQGKTLKTAKIKDAKIQDASATLVSNLVKNTIPGVL